jgi:hypothetical protein
VFGAEAIVEVQNRRRGNQPINPSKSFPIHAPLAGMARYCGESREPLTGGTPLARGSADAVGVQESNLRIEDAVGRTDTIPSGISLFMELAAFDQSRTNLSVEQAKSLKESLRIQRLRCGLEKDDSAPISGGPEAKLWQVGYDADVKAAVVKWDRANRL